MRGVVACLYGIPATILWTIYFAVWYFYGEGWIETFLFFVASAASGVTAGIWYFLLSSTKGVRW